MKSNARDQKKILNENTQSVMFEKKKISKFYYLKGEKFLNPSYISKITGIRDVEMWPSHCKAHIQPTRQILVNNAHSIEVREEHRSKLPSLVAKPKFLSFLETYIQTELNRFKANDVKPTSIRLQIYEEAFEWFIQALKSYRPVLAAIKREYQMNIDYLKAELRKVEPMKELLWTLSQQYDTRMREMQNRDRTGINSLTFEMKHQTQNIVDLKSEKETLKVQIKQLKEDLENEVSFANSERDARKLLIADLHEMTIKLNELVRLTWNTEDKEREDPVKLRWAYESAKGSLLEANKQILDLQIRYNDVVPKSVYDEALKEIKENQKEIIQIKQEKEDIIKEKKMVQNKFDVNCLVRDFLYSELKVTRKKLIGTIPFTKPDKMIIERCENRVEKENLNDAIDKWQTLAADLRHLDFLNLINTELQKTDGSAEVLIEVLSASLQLNATSLEPLSSVTTDN